MSHTRRLRLVRRITIAGLTLGSVACRPSTFSPPAAVEVAPDLGRHQMPISTRSAPAQRAFDRGMTLAWGFSHMTAEEEFRRAGSLDPTSPMPWWGVALVNGPHINYPLVPEKKGAIAWEALTRARGLRNRGTLLEQQLIDALGVRYSSDPTVDRSALDQRYADAMREVWRKHPTNPNIGTLYAEALMDLHPWDLYDSEGLPKAWTPDIVRTLEEVLQLDVNHPGANHLHIHAVEASAAPKRAEASADRLRGLVPGAGHLVHMPGHIYLRANRWEDAAEANLKAMEADERFRKANPRPGFYAIYMAHNPHFLSFVRMMTGRKRDALDAARRMVAEMPPEFLDEYGSIADGFVAAPVEVLVRFGAWDEVLREPQPDERFPYARAMWRFSRATALNALDRRSERDDARHAFREAVAKTPSDATFGNNRARDLLDVATLVLDGEIAAREKRLDDAVKLLREATKLEDALVYDEPPDWIIPVRHSLGIVLLQAGMPKEAEKAYREDLAKFPGNGWSLYGSSRALALDGRADEAAKVKREFERAWVEADTEIESSCMCQAGM